MPLELTGLNQIRGRFIGLLKERQADIAKHALAAWDGETAEVINANLAAAQVNLHRIAGTAGSLGFVELGDAAGKCETEIIAHLQGSLADVPVCPKDLLIDFGTFLSKSEQLVSKHS